MKKNFLLLTSLLFSIPEFSAVLNGIEAQPGQFPFVLQHFPSGCTATFLKPNFALTAAHCQQRAINGQICRSIRRNDRSDCVSFVSTNCFYLPEWRPSLPMTVMRTIDLLIMKLDNKFQPIPNYSPVNIIPRNFQFLPDEIIYTAGFGRISAAIPTQVLRYGTFYLETEGLYLSLISPPPRFALMPGDSGSAAVVIRNNQFIAVGTASGSNQLPYPNGRNTLTFHAPRRDWILNIIGETVEEGCPIPICQ